MKTLNAALTTATQLSAQLNYIDKIDFSLLKKKLMLPLPVGLGWTVEDTIEVEKWYKRFLAICILEPNAELTPSASIDIFWHYHILDTKKYKKDCAVILGKKEIIHHYPYSGIDGRTDEGTSQLKHTIQLFQLYFNEPYQDLPCYMNLDTACDKTDGADEYCKSACYGKRTDATT